MAEPVGIFGTIVSEPQQRVLDDGTSVVNFRFIQEDRYDANRGGTQPDWQDREPKLAFDVEAWRNVGRNLPESEGLVGSRAMVHGVVRQKPPYEKDGVTRDGGVKIEAKEVLISTRNRVVSARKPSTSGNGQPAPQQQGGGWGGPAQQQPAQGGWGQQPPQQGDP